MLRIMLNYCVVAAILLYASTICAAPELKLRTSTGYIPIPTQNCVRIFDTIQVIDTHKENNRYAWYRARPVMREYDNPVNATFTAEMPILYSITGYADSDTLFIPNDQCGTSYYARLPVKKWASMPCTVATPGLLTDIVPNSFQVSVRQNDSYLGYITELLNTPFILIPKLFGNRRHQTDMRIGADCAEMAIYGKRRQGFGYTYDGPRGIYAYLTPISYDSIFNGCIVHFGAQVSVVYQDLGNNGKLDPDDLLIQSYGTGCTIVPVRDCGFFGRTIKVFRWKE